MAANIFPREVEVGPVEQELRGVCSQLKKMADREVTPVAARRSCHGATAAFFFFFLISIADSINTTL